MRLIDADALNMAFTMLRFNEDGTLRHWGDRQNWCLSGQEVEDLINSIPTIEPERKTGRWIEEHIDITDKEHPKSFRFYRCSACSHVAAPALFVDKEKWLSYCPHCGAYMGGEQDETD